MTQRTSVQAYLLLALALAGCGTTSGSTDPEKKNGGTAPDGTYVFDPRTDPVVSKEDFGGVSWPEEKLYDGVDDEKLKHRDSDMVFGSPDDSKVDPVKVAEWVKARREVYEWCLRQEPQRLDQAIAIAEKVIRNVPDSTPDRYNLGVCLHTRMRDFYLKADTLAADMTVLEDQGKKDEAEKTYRQALLQATAYAKKYARGALYHLLFYTEKASMDRRPLDLIWLCYFILGEFEDARRWLDKKIELIPDSDPRKREYEATRDEILRYLTDLKLKGFGKAPALGSAGRGDGGR